MVDKKKLALTGLKGALALGALGLGLSQGLPSAMGANQARKIAGAGCTTESCGTGCSGTYETDSDCDQYGDVCGTGRSSCTISVKMCCW